MTTPTNPPLPPTGPPTPPPVGPPTPPPVGPPTPPPMPPGGMPPGMPPSGGMPPASAPMGKDRTELWGWLGIVLGFCCCGIVGIIFGVLSMRDAKKHGKSPVLGWVAIGVSALSLVINAITAATGNYPWMNRD